jgi:hypothetical protein
MEFEKVRYQSAQIVITHHSGTSGCAIVSFTGIGLGVGVPPEEFARTLASNSHDHFFVIDKNRSWYNGCAQEIIGNLSPMLERFRAVFTLGNSMGGFGAVYFSSRLPNCEAAIAFSPQFSIDPKVVKETRWKQYRRNISRIEIGHAMVGANPERKMYVFIGTKGPDARHAKRFATHATPGLRLFQATNLKHHFVQILRDKGSLVPILEAIFTSREDQLLPLLSHSDVQIAQPFGAAGSTRGARQ